MAPAANMIAPPCMAASDATGRSATPVEKRWGGQLICDDRNLVIEEAATAYKDAGQVVRDLTEAGLVAGLAAMKPLVTYKKALEGPPDRTAANQPRPPGKEGPPCPRWISRHSGNGPVECRIALMALVGIIEAEAGRRGCTIEVAFGHRPDSHGAKSALLSLEGANATALAAEYCGTVKFSSRARCVRATNARTGLSA